jgi:hypothetical protein
LNTTRILGLGNSKIIREYGGVSLDLFDEKISKKDAWL